RLLRVMPGGRRARHSVVDRLCVQATQWLPAIYLPPCRPRLSYRLRDDSWVAAAAFAENAKSLPSRCHSMQALRRALSVVPEKDLPAEEAVASMKGRASREYCAPRQGKSRTSAELGRMRVDNHDLRQVGRQVVRLFLRRGHRTSHGLHCLGEGLPLLALSEPHPLF